MLSECQILIVEPDASLRLDLADLLKRAGYQVLTVAGVFEALHILNQVRVQVVICASDLMGLLRLAMIGLCAAPLQFSRAASTAPLVMTDIAQVDARDLWTVSLDRPILVDELLRHVAQRLKRRRDYVCTEAD